MLPDQNRSANNKALAYLNCGGAVKESNTAPPQRAFSAAVDVAAKAGDMQSPVTRQEIEQKMDELAREYHDTHDPEIPEQILELARRLREMDH